MGMFCLLAGVSLSSAPHAANAQPTRSWAAPASGSWGDPTKWIPAGVPGINDVVEIAAASTPYTVTLQGTASVAKLSVGNGATLVVNGSPTKGNALLRVANGITNAGALRLESSGGGQASNILSTGGALVNTGSLEVNLGSGGQRLITADLNNQGQVQINAPLTFNKVNGVYTNSGTWVIAAGQTLSIASGSQIFNQNAGTLQADGDFALRSTTFNFNGGDIEGSGAVLTAAALNIGPASGAGLLTLRGTCVLSGNVGAAQTLWVNGNTAGGTGYLRATAGFTNAGTIRLQSSGGVFASNILLTSGALVNTGLIEVNAGTGGQRQIAADLNNQGALAINTPTTFTKAGGVYTNTGHLSIAAGQTLSIASGSQIFNQNAGTLDAQGELRLTAVPFNYNGGAVTGGGMILRSATLNLGALSGAGAFTLRGACNLNGNVAGNQVLWVRGSSAGGHALLRMSAEVTNEGLIRLESTDGLYTANLTATSTTAALVNKGVIEVNQGSGSQRLIGVDLDNQGVLDINAITLLNKTNGRYTNSGELSIAAGQTLTINGGYQVFNQNSGTLAIDGAFLGSGIAFNFNGGAISGNQPVLKTVALTLGSASGPVGLVLQGASLLKSDIRPDQTLWVKGSQAGVNATLRADAGFTNAGAIRLESTEALYTSNLLVTTGTLLNTGVIAANAGSGGQRLIAANLDNQGRFEVNTPVVFSKSGGVYTNTGEFIVAAGQSLSITGRSQVFNQNDGILDAEGEVKLTGMTFNFNGGTVAGNSPVLAGVRLRLGPESGAASLVLRGGCTLDGNVAMGQTLWVKKGVLAVKTGFVNAGTIRIENTESTSPFISYLLGKGELVNTGSIELDEGVGGVVAIVGNLDNRGALAVNCARARLTYFDKTYDGQFPDLQNAVYRNTGRITIGPSSSLDVRGGVFHNAGTIDGGGELVAFFLTLFNAAGTTIEANVVSHRSTFNIGSAVGATGVLNIHGSYTQSTVSALNIKMGGYDVGSGFDRLNVTGAATVAGTLKVNLINGFRPAPCDHFQVLTYGAQVGSFEKSEGFNLGSDLALRPNFGPTGLELLARAPSAKVNFIPTALNAAESGGSHPYQVCLSEQPAGAVRVVGVPDAQVALSPPELVFAEAAWGAVQSFSVAAVDDPVTEGLHRGTVAHAVHSADPRFEGAVVGQIAVQIEDNDVLPAIAISDVSVTEGDAGESVATFAVSLSNPSSQAVTVAYATANGTATSGSDYVAATGTLNLAPGETSKTISIIVNGDLTNEGDEIFTVNLTNAVNATLADAQGLGTILTDDHAPKVSLAAPSIALLWPPDHKMVHVQITGLTDADADPLTVAITKITQDEAVYGAENGEKAEPDGAGIGTEAVQVRAEREGGGNGRVYQIYFTVTDGHEGGLVAGSVKVGVPYNANDTGAIDDGQKYNSVTGGLEGVAAKVAAALSGDEGFGVGNYPNPFNPATTLVYTLAEEALVRLAIYNMLGQRVRVLVEDVQGPGNYGMEWDSTDELGHQVGAGIYFYRLEAGPRVAVGKMLLVR